MISSEVSRFLIQLVACIFWVNWNPHLRICWIGEIAYSLEWYCHSFFIGASLFPKCWRPSCYPIQQTVLSHANSFFCGQKRTDPLQYGTCFSKKNAYPFRNLVVIGFRVYCNHHTFFCVFLDVLSIHRWRWHSIRAHKRVEKTQEALILISEYHVLG